jgi:3-polyprenyl-4-hydroxybenzoate decarboxylase
MANKDLRSWIDDVRAAGELKTITGAEPKEEIGGIVDIYMRKMANPAVLFDEVPGFPKGPPSCSCQTGVGIFSILTSLPSSTLSSSGPPLTALVGFDGAFLK